MNPLPADLFARRLRHERERLGISQAELARRVAELLDTNVDPSAITRIEHQVRAVRLDEAVAVSRALGLPLAEMISEDATAEKDAQLRRYLSELAAAQRTMEQARLDIHRLVHSIRTLDQSTDLTDLVDPQLLEAVDARVPLDREGPATAPDA